MNQTTQNKIFKEAGWNKELIEAFFEDPQPGVNTSKDDVEANAFFKVWFDNRIKALADKVSRPNLNWLMKQFADAHYNLDEPYTGSVNQVVQQTLGRPPYKHDNDHEWFALSDAITEKVKRRINIILMNYLASR